MPEQAKVCSPEVQGSKFLVLPPRCAQEPQFYHFTVIAAKAALELHSPTSPRYYENEVQNIAPLLLSSPLHSPECPVAFVHTSALVL